ncbi:MAG: Gfo/Idh/MocA family oxidoreductase [Terriglobia bacterium]
MSQMTRRRFAKTMVAVGAASALSRMRVQGANDRIRLGFIGLGNRGDQVLDAFLVHKDAEVVAICDLWQPYLDFAAKKIGGNPKQFKDYRKLLELKDVDGVVIATPDHWHALQTVHAYQAEKDVYTEKPMSLRVAEGRRMVQVARQYKRVTQVGFNRRSSPMCKEAADFLRDGGMGKITAIRTFHIQNEWPAGIGNPPDEEPPAGFDWDAWLGPAPKVPYNRNRAFYRFRWFYNYSGGQVTNFGAHFVDFVHWVLGHDAPLAVTAMGAKLAIEDNREIPDTLEVLWTYPGGTLVTFSQFNANAAPADRRHGIVEVRGTKGTFHLSYEGYEIVPEEINDKVFPALTPLDRSLSQEYGSGRKPVIAPRKGAGDDGTTLHARNFLDCIRSRQACTCDIEIGHRGTSATLIANIAHQTKSYLQWDGKAERFTNNLEANKHLNYEYRAPYKLPEG